MSAEAKPARDLTDEEVYVRNAQHQAEVVAQKLETLAARLRQLGESGFNSTNRRTGAVGVAADIVSEFTQGVGNIGTFLWGVVHNAEHLDRYRREESVDRRGGTR